MIEQIQRDRVIQVLVGIAILVSLVACFLFVAAGLRYTNRSEVYPERTVAPQAPVLSPVPPDSGLVVDKQRFEGQGNKVEVFTIYREGLVYFTASHNADRATRPFSVWLKNSGGENIKLLMLSQGTSENEVVENLPPGDYILEITGDIWAITVLHNK